MAEQISNKGFLLQHFMGYKSSVTTLDGYTFDGGKKRAEAGSIYSSGGQKATATIAANVVKAVLMLFSCGVVKGKTYDPTGVASYDATKKASTYALAEQKCGENEIDCCAYWPKNGVVKAAHIDQNTGIPEVFNVGFGKRYGCVIMMAILVAEKATNNEVAECMNSIDSILTSVAGRVASLTSNEHDQLLNALATLSDNIYFRLGDGSLKLRIQSSKNEKESEIDCFDEIALQTNSYCPTEKGMGSKDWEVFSLAAGASKKSSVKKLSVSRDSFLKDYILNEEEKLSESEKLLIPELPSWYKISSLEVEICNFIKSSSSFTKPIRNILLYGPAGTGKTEKSKAIASALHKPYTHITGSAGMELFDIIGQILPATDGVVDCDAESMAKRYDLPSVLDVYADTKAAYQKITGEEAPEPIDEIDVISLLFEKQWEIVNSTVSQGQNGKDFVWVPSQFIQAIKNGWVVEFQEPTVILQAGVLPGLNSVLEGGSISLPTGEIVKRHPDSVIIFTTNTDYEGCRPLNQSVRDRFPLKYDIQLPSEKELIERAKEQTGCTDDVLVTSCVRCLNETAEYLDGLGCDSSNVGARTLYAWIQAAMILGGDSFRAAECTLITSATDEEEVREYIRNNILTTHF